MKTKETKLMEYRTPAITWLYLTNYLHDWLFNEYGGRIKIYGKPVISLAHVSDVRRTMKMETREDKIEPEDSVWSISAMRMDCMKNGIELSPTVIREKFKLTPDRLNLFVPIECPKMALTCSGVMRPWNRLTTFGRNQADMLRKIIFRMFWGSMAELDNELKESGDEQQTAIALTEQFCQRYNISDVYAQDIRREWMRQRKKFL